MPPPSLQTSPPAPDLQLRRLVHELNTPVGVSAMAASMLPAQVDAIVAAMDAPLQRNLAAQLEEWRESVALVQNGLQLCVQVLRNSARVRPPQEAEPLACLDLHDTVRRGAAVALAMRPEVQVNLQLRLADPFTVHGDSGAWHQVVVNLVSNSIMHGFDGRSQGTIQIAATPLPGNRIVVQYYDDGAGFSNEARARLFEDGFSTRQGRGGHGLGMGIVRDLVHNTLGGRMEVHHPAKGVHISIEAPS